MRKSARYKRDQQGRAMRVMHSRGFGDGGNGGGGYIGQYLNLDQEIRAYEDADLIPRKKSRARPQPSMPKFSWDK